MSLEITLPWPPRELSPNSRKFWNEDEIEILRNAYAGGCYVNVSELAAKLNRSKYSVHVKASRLGLGDSRRAGCEQPKQRTRKFETASERSAFMSARQKELIAERGHPRHMKGKHHSDEAKALISVAAKRMNDSRTDEQKSQYLLKAMKTKIANGTYALPRPGTTWKAGWREIGGIRKYYRSKWEANYAYYLEWLKSNKQIADWKHEPRTFWFEGVKRGTVSYLPDFWVQEISGKDSFHEVKGWMDARSKTKIARMAKYYPEIKLVVIDSKGYEALRRSVKGLVPGWEE